MAARSVEQVARELEHEREQLAAAVSTLRGELRQLTDIRTLVRSNLAPLAALAVVGSGALVTARLIRRRRRRAREFRLGRFTLVDRG